MLFATGSPYDGVDCSFCHNGGALAPIISIAASPSFGVGNTYFPNTTYTINVNCSGIYPKYGFDIEILNTDSLGAGDAGSFDSAIVNCKIVPASKAPTNVTHLAPTGNNDSALFQFSWTAPPAGNAYLYCAVNGCNFDGTTAGDHVGKTSMILTSGISGVSFYEENTLEITVFPNPNNGEFFVRTNRKSPKKLFIYDIQGNLIEGLHSCSENIKFDLRKNPKGIYFIKCTDKKHSSAQKFVIE